LDPQLPGGLRNSKGLRIGCFLLLSKKLNEDFIFENFQIFLLLAQYGVKKN